MLLVLALLAGSAAGIEEPQAITWSQRDHVEATHVGEANTGSEEEDDFNSALQVSLSTITSDSRNTILKPFVAEEGNVSEVSERLAKSALTILAPELCLPFVTIKAQGQPFLNSTRVEVHVATPTKILCANLFMYMPVLLLWGVFLCKGAPQWGYAVLLPFTVCMLSVGVNVVNQALAALVDAPMAITYIQAAFLCLVSGSWSLGSEMHRPTLGRHLLFPLSLWMGAAILYSAQQTLSHLVTYRSSLCERTLLLSCCPILSHFVEGRGSVQAHLALATMTLGAALLSLQMIDLTFEGVSWVCLLVATSVPLSILERWLLAKWPGLPIPPLAFFDSALLLGLSTGISAIEQAQFWESWEHWVSNDSILCLLCISLVCFGAGKLGELALLRVSTASNLLVLRHLANVVVVATAIIFFGEHVRSPPVAVAGIFICMAGDLWYVLELSLPQRKVPSRLARNLKAGAPLRSESLNSLSSREGSTPQARPRTPVLSDEDQDLD